MTRSMRLMSIALLLTGLGLAPSSNAADLDTLMREFRVTATGLKPAPAFNLKTLGGTSATLVDHGGRPVLLYFWATW